MKLIDFGIAKRVESPTAQSPGAESVELTLARQDQILGTIDFMAPEQILETSATDIRSDHWTMYGFRVVMEIEDPE